MAYRTRSATPNQELRLSQLAPPADREAQLIAIENEDRLLEQQEIMREEADEDFVQSSQSHPSFSQEANASNDGDDDGDDDASMNEDSDAARTDVQHGSDHDSNAAHSEYDSDIDVDDNPSRWPAGGARHRNLNLFPTQLLTGFMIKQCFSARSIWRKKYKHVDPTPLIATLYDLPPLDAQKLWKFCKVYEEEIPDLSEAAIRRKAIDGWNELEKAT